MKNANKLIYPGVRICQNSKSNSVEGKLTLFIKQKIAGKKKKQQERKKAAGHKYTSLCISFVSCISGPSQFQ